MCAIPARAGSKRLPGKNLRRLAGHPMIAYSIMAALESQLFDAIYVCTEDETIANVACEYGANVPLLVPSELCEDLVASHIPCQYVAKYLAGQSNEYDVIVCLQPTSPLRSASDIVAAVHRFHEDDLDFLVSVTAIDPHYFHWAVVPGKDNSYWHMYFGDRFLVERPLLPSVYRPNGSIKIADLESLQKTGNFFGERLGVIEIPEERAIHVGTSYEFNFCESLLDKGRI
jgi:CMP-N-acetylneuraminic acid synthetase